MQTSKNIGIVTHWEAAVVEENIALLELAKLSLLLILLDGISDLIGGNLVLFPVGDLMGKARMNIRRNTMSEIRK